MSGLNDDIEEDVEQELPGKDKLDITVDQFKTIDPSTMQPGDNQPAAPKVVLQVGEDEVDDQGNSIKPTVSELFGEDVVPNELPDLNAKIVLMETKQNTITDATSTLNTIKFNGAISQEDIQEINSILPDYLNDNERIEYYTKTPTLTRYTTAVNTIGFKIADQKQEQLTLTVDTFSLLKDSIVKTQTYLKETLVDTNSVRKDHTTMLLEFIEENLKDRDVSGYHAVIEKLMNNNIQVAAPNSVKKISNYLEAALNIVRRPTAFACLLNKSLFLKETMDQDFVFYSLSSPDNLSDRSVRPSLKELIEFTYSSEKLQIIGLLDDILAAAVTYVDDSIFAIKNHDASDIGKQPEPLEVLKRESQAIVAVNVLAMSMADFDKVMLDITTEFAKIIKSIP